MWPNTDEQLIRNAIFFSALKWTKKNKNKILLENRYDLLELLPSCQFHQPFSSVMSSPRFSMQFWELNFYRAMQERETAGFGISKTQKLEGRLLEWCCWGRIEELSPKLVLMLVSCCSEDLADQKLILLIKDPFRFSLTAVMRIMISSYKCKNWHYLASPKNFKRSLRLTISQFSCTMDGVDFTGGLEGKKEDVAGRAVLKMLFPALCPQVSPSCLSAGPLPPLPTASLSWFAPGASLSPPSDAQ